MGRRIFDRDPVTGLTRYFHPSDDGESFTIETVMDVEPILETNKRFYNAESHKSSRKFKGDMKRVASIPMHIYMELIAKGLDKDQKALRKWLTDSENLAFRVGLGRV